MDRILPSEGSDVGSSPTGNTMEIQTQISPDLYYDERSAGGIVYKIEKGKAVWLVVKYLSRGIKKNIGKHEMIYKFPKGHLKDKEVLKQAALREVEEE